MDHHADGEERGLLNYNSIKAASSLLCCNLKMVLKSVEGI